MRAAAVLREAWRDLATGAAHALTWALAAAVAIGLAIVADAVATGQMVSQARAYRDSGAATLVLNAMGHVSGAQCEALGQVDGVAAAGALRRSDVGLGLTALPGKPVPFMTATPGLMGLLMRRPADQVEGGLYLQADTALTLGVRPGARLETTAGRVPIAGTFPYPDDGRTPGLGYAAVAVSPPEGAYDQCWAEIWPEASGGRDVLLTAMLGGAARQPDAPPYIQQLNSAHGITFTSSYAARLTRYAPAAAAAAGLLCGFLAVWRRRVEMAAGRLHGVPAGSQTAIGLLETLAWTALGAILASPALAWAATRATGEWSTALARCGGLCVAAFAAGAAIGTVAGSLAVRPAHLARYLAQ
jgi:hypothetical protein